MQLDPQSVTRRKKEDKGQIVALFVSGQYLCEGPSDEIRRRFEQECASHKAIVEIKVKDGFGWRTTQSRKVQK